MNIPLNRFGGSVMEGLAERVSGTSVAQRLPLSVIEPDPTQPRRHFDQDALDLLAASIRAVGVLQPIGVCDAGPGRYRIAWGERRWRAAKLAGLADIPIVVVDAGRVSVEAQVIENQHRAANSNSELAWAVAKMTADGLSNEAIATALALRDAQTIKHYRAVAELAPELAAWVDQAPIRAVYELHMATRKGDEERSAVVAALATMEPGKLTVTAARDIVEDATGKPQKIVDGLRAPRRDSQRSDPDAQRVARVRAWLADTTRPRPPLSV